MGGEKLFLRPLRCAVYGSPPHGRGKVVVSWNLRLFPGITPAWAGKRSWAAAVARGHPDHPRAGGEKSEEIPAGSTCEGSPPRGRGKVAGDEIPGDVLGITPAQAGKSKLALCTPSCPTDHPRVGGEKSTFLNSMSFPPGSPPRRRGKAGKNGGCDFGDRITPAWAGKSYACCPVLSLSEDHPRMGGEKIAYQNILVVYRGSPPHGRGKGKGWNV